MSTSKATNRRTHYWRTVLRTSAAPRAAIVLVPWLVVYSGNLSQWINQGYWESVTAQSTFLLGFIAPACAACAAWEGTRVKISGMLRSAPSRSPLQISASVLWPVGLLGAVSIMLSLALVASQASGAPGWPSLAMLALALIVVAAHTAAGYVGGLLLPRLLAAPAALVVSFVWMAYPAAMDNPPWLRQLNGHNLSECCALDQVAAHRALLAPAVLAVGVTVACALWVAARRVPRLVAPVALAGSLVAGPVLAAPLGDQVARPRDPGALDCRTGPSGICLWPEQRAAAQEIEEWGAQARRNLKAAGVAPARDVKVMSSAPDRGEVLSVMAFSALPPDIPVCAQNGPWPGSRAAGPVTAWVVLAAGARPQDVEGAYAEDDLRLARTVRDLPAAAQKRWFERNLAAMSGCDRQPELRLEPFTEAAR